VCFNSLLTPLVVLVGPLSVVELDLLLEDGGRAEGKGVGGQLGLLLLLHGGLLIARPWTGFDLWNLGDGGLFLPFRRRDNRRGLTR